MICVCCTAYKWIILFRFFNKNIILFIFLSHIEFHTVCLVCKVPPSSGNRNSVFALFFKLISSANYLFKCITIHFFYFSFNFVNYYKINKSNFMRRKQLKWNWNHSPHDDTTELHFKQINSNLCGNLQVFESFKSGSNQLCSVTWKSVSIVISHRSVMLIGLKNNEFRWHFNGSAK